MTSGDSQPASSCAIASAAMTADCFWSAGNLAISRSIFLYACSDNTIVFASNIDAPRLGRTTLSVNLAENDVLGADDGDRVRDHMALGHFIEALQVREAWRADLQAI